MEMEIFKGLLTQQDGKAYLQADDGTRYLEDEAIWSGYLRHWTGKVVCARRLSQRDYETGRPIIILWPDVPASACPFVELYYNERLVKYGISRMGHVAVNVDGEVFNYSSMANENEAMRPEEYFFRPALGEFAPDPATMRNNLSDRQRPYYDKFGRLFMRTIHVLRIEGLDTRRLSQFLHSRLDLIYNTPPDPKKPGKYTQFSIFKRSCATFIRDGFRDLGFRHISGIMPRDLFINAAWFFLKQNQDPAIRASCHVLPQLLVPEAPPSALSPITNPCNRRKYNILSQR